MQQKTNNRNRLIILVVFIIGITYYNCSSANDMLEGDQVGLQLQPELNYAKGNTYKKEWRVIDSLETNGLSKSALVEVKKILEKSKKENSHEQIIKALIVKAKFQSKIEEGAFVATINELNLEASRAKYPLKPLLHSIIAEMYHMFYQNNRWKFQNRSQTVNFDNTDINTWSVAQITDASIKHYMLSLVNIDSLKRTPVETFDEIISANNARAYRPYLYDFLAHRAADYFINEETNLTRPIDEFVLDDSSYIMPYDQFVLTKIQTKDSMSLKYYALQILQNLTVNHIPDSNPKALIDIELKRLKFVRNNALFENSDTLYYNAVTSLYKQHPKHSSAAEIVCEMAKIYQSRGNAYKFSDPLKYKWDLKTAVTLCKNAINKYPGSYGADLCKQLKLNIETKALKVKIEKANVPNQPIRAQLTFKNFRKVYYKIVQVNFDDFSAWNKNLNYDDRFEKIRAAKTVTEWTDSLPNDGDFREHSGDIKIDALTKGFYLLLTGTTEKFTKEKEAVAVNPFWVTNLSYLSRTNEKGDVDFFVLDRNKGVPIAGVKASLYYKKYDYDVRRRVTKSLGTKITDDNGFFKVLPNANNQNFYADLSIGDDRFNNESSHYQYRYGRSRKSQTKTVFFTDRAIYRPGQTIYFKGIVLESDGRNKNKIKANFSSNVVFYDVNGQKVGGLLLTTNEYGTYSGSFVAPNNGLNGQMRLSDGNGYQYISVEEYKRPKFEVKFNPIKGTYKLDEKVNVVGNAKTYSGAVLDGAEVNYRVVRDAEFPYWCRYYWGFSPYSREKELKNGTTKTDDNGEFKIDFIAQPDQSIHKKYSPTYSYKIYADVIDINGETHSSSTYVNVGYNALNINISIPENVNKNGIDTIKFTTTNLNGVHESAEGNVKVWALKMPSNIYRKSLWDKSDIHFMDKEVFEKHFPLDEYEDENNKYKWEKHIKVYDHNFNTANQKSLELFHLPEWETGYYVIEAIGKDKFGQEVKAIKYFTVFNEFEKHSSTNQIASFIPLKIKGEPGENAEFLIASAAKDVEVWYEVEHQNNIVKKQWIKLSASQQKVSIPILEKHRGNFQVYFTFVKHGRSFTYQSTVNVPHSNKQLKLEFETFRNKLLPGQKETWKVKIKGNKGEKVAAEMVAALYDASLDAFKPNYWGLNVHHYNYTNRNWQNNSSFSATNSQLFSSHWNPSMSFVRSKIYDKLNWFGYYYGGRYSWEDNRNVSGGMLYSEDEMEEVTEESVRGDKSMKNSSPKVKRDAIASVSNASSFVDDKTKEGNIDLAEVKARKNFNETAFFYPHLATNSLGEVIIEFTIPESLTRWKFMGLAHTKDLKTGMLYGETVTQKDLMVYPNAPRFFRESDQMTFSSKITNLSDKDLLGDAQVFFYDALTMKQISSTVLQSAEKVSFKVEQGKSTQVSWQINIPEGFSAITYKVVAKAGNFTDGEEMAIPVLTNRMLVTESMPLPVRGKGVTNFKFNKLLGSASSASLKHHSLTLEFTSNPAWYAIQALPYLMEYPYECAEQTFSRFYANAIAAHIAQSNPKISAVFESWKNSSPASFLSNLEKNQELKALVLEETPWVLASQNESERKRRVGLLFDLNKMNNELGKALKKLEQLQVSNGGWTWFKGMPESRYMTQHIVTGMGHLDNLGVQNIRKNAKTWSMVKKAVLYLDDRINEDYKRLKKYSADLEKDYLNYEIIQYLYARSYFLADVPVKSSNKEAYNYYHKQTQKYWLNKSRYMQGMIALTLHRDLQPKTGIHVEHKIMASLKENAINNDELGMYWKDNKGGYYWYQAPIETQALLIEAFDEVMDDKESVEAMKVWLLKQKQTQDWKTTKATTEACYALLLSGSDLLASDDLVEIKVGNKVIDPKKMDGVKVEAGTGYFKTAWSKSAITPSMGNVTVTKKDDGVAWGALYWQYFEQLDKITPHETPLKLKKALFVQKNSAAGPVILPIVAGTKLVPGDKIKVRIELRVDRDMEYVHMKDMRAAGLEPINVFSGYRYQGGLGYYESTKDASTNFFFDFLAKGTYVFEYPLRVNMAGNFSNGITSIQCMYAPEFTAHSKGERLIVKSK